MSPRRFFSFAASCFAVFSAACSAAPAEETSETSSDALCSTECPSGTLSGDALLTPVTRTNRLRSEWAPATTSLPAAYRQPGNQSMRTDVASRFMAMADAAKAAGAGIACLSGYRSFQTQCSLFASYASANGCEEANTFSAHAGHSEHQLGTVCDIAKAETPTTFLKVGDGADGWLRAHAHEYGFANSYPNADASLNDGYIQEVWHYRYIGVKAAAALKAKEASLPSGQRLAVPVFIAGLSAAERAALDVDGPAPPPPPANDVCGSGGQARQGVYCARAINGDANDTRLVTCANGVTTQQTSCDAGCKEMAAGQADQCEAAPPPNACETGAKGVTGTYCGVGLGIAAGAPGSAMLFTCKLDGAGKMSTAYVPCANGCQEMPSGTPDKCK